MIDEPTTLYNYGAIIRLNREHQNLSLSALSDISGVSISQLSKIERGCETATDDVVGFLLEALGIKYELIKSSLLTLQDDFLKFYKSIVYLDDEKKVNQILKELNKKYLSIIITPELLLANSIYHLTFTNELDKAIEYLFMIDKIKDNLLPKYTQIYYDYMGVYYKDTKRIDKSLYYLNLALQSGNDVIINSMIYYHLGAAYRLNRQLLKAYQSLMQAKKLFMETDNYIRGCMSDVTLANIHSVSGEYHEALNILDKCLENYERLHLPIDDLATVYINKIFINILNDRYKCAYDIIEHIDEKIKTYLELKKKYQLYRVIIYTELEKYEKVLEICKPYIRSYDKDKILDNCIMYYYHRKGTKTNRLKYLNQIKILIKQSGDLSSYRLLFKMLKRECSSERQLIEMNELMYKYIFNSFE